MVGPGMDVRNGSVGACRATDGLMCGREEPLEVPSERSSVGDELSPSACPSLIKGWRVEAIIDDNHQPEVMVDGDGII